MSIRRENFNISAGAGTDIWRKPPNTNVFNAPSQLEAAIPLKQLSSTRITFTGKWEHQYDQAGLLLCFFPPSSSPSDSIPSSWIKAGLEFYNGSPKISFVGCDQFADWSLHELMKGADSPQENVTIELRREGDENGYALWAYQLILDHGGAVTQRYPIRECTWPYGKADDERVQIGPCVARPSKHALAPDEKLQVTFREFTIDLRQP